MPVSSRFEREAQQRRYRARNHLARARRRRGHEPGFWRNTSRGGGRAWRALGGPFSREGSHLVFAAVSLGLGLALGASAWPQVSDVLSGGPAGLERIEIRGTERLDPREVARATGIEPGARLSTLDPAGAVARLSEHDWIASARALRVPGGTLVVEVVEREPLAIVAAGTPPRAFAVDASGTPFAPLDLGEDALPRLRGAGKLEPRVADDRLAQAIALAGKLRGFGLAAPEEIGVPTAVLSESSPEANASDGFTLRFRELPTRFVLGEQALDLKVERLAQVVSRRPGEVVRAMRVDLRFQDQAVLSPHPARKGSEAAAARGYATPSRQRRSG